MILRVSAMPKPRISTSITLENLRKLPRQVVFIAVYALHSPSVLGNQRNCPMNQVFDNGLRGRLLFHTHHLTVHLLQDDLGLHIMPQHGHLQLRYERKQQGSPDRGFTPYPERLEIHDALYR